MKVLEVLDLYKTFKKDTVETEVLKGVTFDVEEGDFLGIMGRSWCGKTTLMRQIGLIDRPTSGTVKIMGKSIREYKEHDLADMRREKIGFVFQDFRLIDTLTVEDNILLPLILGEKGQEGMFSSCR